MAVHQGAPAQTLTTRWPISDPSRLSPVDTSTGRGVLLAREGGCTCVRVETVSPGKPLRAAPSPFVAAVVILLGALLLLWPTILNRQPFFLSDTTSYIRGADAAVYKAFGVRTDWTERFFDRYGTGQQERNAAAAAQAPAEGTGRPITLSGRSIYYGALLYTADRLGGLWLAAVLQALLASLCLYLTLVRFIHGRRDAAGPFLLLTAALSAGSSLAYFTGYLTPDLFSGLGILAAAHLLCRGPPLTAGQKTFWFVVLCWSALAHGSNILILLVVVVALLLATFTLRMPDRRAIALIVCAIAVGIAGELLFSGAVRAISGDAPVRPPFLSARLIADGPGLAYLERTCPRSGFELCRHVDGMSGSSDAILWGQKGTRGVFSAVGNDERRRLGNEDLRFALAVLADRPVDVIGSSTRSVLAQAGKWRLREFNNVPGQSSELLAKLPPRVAGELAGSLAYRQTMPVRGVEMLSLVATLAGLALLLWALLRRSTDPELRLFLAVLLLGIAADIAVCGAISTPHDRYSMRVLWLIPMGAFINLIQPCVGRRTGATSDASRSAAQKASTG